MILPLEPFGYKGMVGEREENVNVIAECGLWSAAQKTEDECE
jgi:hypothetical protein